MATVAELLRLTEGLTADSPARDLEILLGHVLGKTRTWLYTWPEFELDELQLEQFTRLLQRRQKGEPVAYLTGQRDFWSLSLQVDPSTLIPRPETETLVEWALQLPLPSRVRALDLGTGSGAIALALASQRPAWDVIGIDSSEPAVELARENARANDLERTTFFCSDWFAALPGRRFELIVSNPPYVDEADPHLQRGDVRFEPSSALVAGNCGIADLAYIVGEAPNYLESGGWLLLEHGFEQGEAVRSLLYRRGFAGIETRTDLAGLERISGGCLNAQ